MITVINSICFFDKYKIGSLRKMQRYFGVKHSSYAGHLIQRLYYQYFGNAYNLKKYYKKYYSKEFNDFVDFIECKFNVKREFAAELCDKHIWFTSITKCKEDIRYSFDTVKDLVELFNEYVGGIKHED